MSIFYKFASSKEYDTVHIDSNEIPLGKLKQLIIQQKKLNKAVDFDLIVQNAQTGEGFYKKKHEILTN